MKYFNDNFFSRYATTFALRGWTRFLSHFEDVSSKTKTRKQKSGHVSQTPFTRSILYSSPRNSWFKRFGYFHKHTRLKNWRTPKHPFTDNDYSSITFKLTQKYSSVNSTKSSIEITVTSSPLNNLENLTINKLITYKKKEKKKKKEQIGL